MANEVVTTENKHVQLRQLLNKCQLDISRALPKGFDPERLIRIALTSVRKNPALLECSQESFLGAVIRSAQLGLDPDTETGSAYLVPFRNRHTGQQEVNFMPGYRGLMELVYRDRDRPAISAEAAYEGDEFKYMLGSMPRIDHVPAQPRQPGVKLTYVYAVAVYADGRRVQKIMQRSEVEAIRARSKAQKFSPWQTDYEAMALKTVIRRLVKLLPMSAQLQTAVGLDEVAEREDSQKNESLLTPADAPILTKGERIDEKMEQDEGGEFSKFKDTKI